jgi:DNA-binding transcriptional LysR family regulator
VREGAAIADGIGKLDVDAMRMLVTIHDRGSFTLAAEQLGVNQSTASYTIRLIRAALGDPLFLRSGNRVVPTERCAELVEGLRSILDRLDRLATQRPFDPAHATGEIVISCNLHERRTLIPQALRRIRSAAPGLTVHLFESAVDGRQQLIENRADILLGPVAIVGDIFYRRHLFTDRYVCVMDPGNPLAAATMTLDTFARADHLWITHNGRWQALFLQRLAELGLQIHPRVTSPSHDNITELIADTSLVATIPARLAGALSPDMVQKPFPLDVEIVIDMYWTARTHASGVHQWVRAVLADAADQALR